MTPLQDLARRVRSDWGLARDSGWRVLRAAGPDRGAFLQGLLSQDVSGLRPGEGAPCAFLDRRGHLQTELLVHETGPEALLFVPGDRAEMLASSLLGFRIMDRVEIDPVPWECWMVSGPGAPGVMEGLGAPGVEDWRLGHGGDLEGAVAVRARRTGERDFFVALSPDASQHLVSRFPKGWEDHVMDAAALEALRIEAGLPVFPAEIDGRRLAQEVDLHDAVSLDKGCYLGQETMARLAHQGQLRKGLAGWIVEGDEAVRVPAPVYRDGAEVGQLTSSCRGLSRAGVLALGILRHDAREANGVYNVGDPKGPKGLLHDLPFVRGSGRDVDPRRERD